MSDDLVSILDGPTAEEPKPHVGETGPDRRKAFIPETRDEDEAPNDFLARLGYGKTPDSAYKRARPRARMS